MLTSVLVVLKTDYYFLRKRETLNNKTVEKVPTCSGFISFVRASKRLV